jgi:hypothetical protein
MLLLALEILAQKLRAQDWQAPVQPAQWPRELRSAEQQPALAPQSAAELEQRRSR